MGVFKVNKNCVYDLPREQGVVSGPKKGVFLVGIKGCFMGDNPILEGDNP